MIKHPFINYPFFPAPIHNHTSFTRPILRIPVDANFMVKIPVYEFPPVINIATIQDIECQTGNRIRESPEYLVGQP